MTRDLYNVMLKLASFSPDVVFHSELASPEMEEPRTQQGVVTNRPPFSPREPTQFMSPHVTGDYGHRLFSQEETMSRTPALPVGDENEPERVTSVKTSGYRECLRKLGFRIAEPGVSPYISGMRWPNQNTANPQQGTRPARTLPADEKKNDNALVPYNRNA